MKAGKITQPQYIDDTGPVTNETQRLKYKEQRKGTNQETAEQND